MISNPDEQLVQLMGIYLAGNGWQGLDYATAGNQISGEDFATIDRLKQSVPEAIQMSLSLQVFLKE
jgi:hypothetical protein